MNFNLIDSRAQGIFRTVLECLFFFSPFERAFVSRVGRIQEESQCVVFLHKTHGLNFLTWNFFRRWHHSLGLQVKLFGELLCRN